MDFYKLFQAYIGLKNEVIVKLCRRMGCIPDKGIIVSKYHPPPGIIQENFLK